MGAGRMNKGCNGCGGFCGVVCFRSFRCASVPSQSSLNNHYEIGRRGGGVEHHASMPGGLRCLAASPFRMSRMSHPLCAGAREARDAHEFPFLPSASCGRAREAGGIMNHNFGKLGECFVRAREAVGVALRVDCR